MKDPRIFEEVYRAFFPGLLSFATWLTGDEQDAREIVQDVFLKIWINGALSGNDPRLKAYLYTAVKNKSMNVIRDKKRNLEWDRETDIQDYRLNAQEQLEYRTLKSQIDFAISKLPDRCRMVFLLRRREDLSIKSIAALMGISEKTVENQMTKALRLIKEFLEKNKT